MASCARISPETKPTPAPTAIEPHNGVNLSGWLSRPRRNRRIAAAHRSTVPVTQLYSRSSSTMVPPTSAVGSDATRRGRSLAQSTKRVRLKRQVEYVAATIFSRRAVGRISLGGKEAKAIKTRNAVPPAWPTVAYKSEIAAKNGKSIPPTCTKDRVAATHLKGDLTMNEAAVKVANSRLHIANGADWLRGQQPKTAFGVCVSYGLLT